MFYASITPLLVWFIIKKTIVEPMNAEHRQRKIDKIKELNKQRIAEKRQEAEAAIELMAALYERIFQDEQRRKGLIITSARYGRFDDDNAASVSGNCFEYNSKKISNLNDLSCTDERRSDWSADGAHSEPTIIDVTLPLQCLIKDSRLRLQKNSKVILKCFHQYRKYLINRYL